MPRGTQRKQEPSQKDEKLLFLLDVLGFESFFSEHGLAYTRTLYGKLVQFLERQTGGLAIVPVPTGDGTFTPAVGWVTLEHSYFSDTILFWTNYDSLRVWPFTETCADLVCHCLELGFAVRGGIAVGEAILDNTTRTYIGEPLIEVARVEKAQRWIGVSFGPSFARPPYNRGLLLKGLLAYRRHCKEGQHSLVPGLVLDWPRKWRETRNRDIHALLAALDRDERYGEYFRITHDFVDFSLANHDWFTKQSHLPIR